MRRSVPLLRSDYIFEPIGQQGHTYGLAQWLPFFGTGAKSRSTPTPSEAACAPATRSCWDMRNKDLDYDLMRKADRRVAGRRPVLSSATTIR